jgi:hypothetical protein
MKNQLYYLPLLLLLLLCSPTPSTAQQQDTYRRWSDIFPNGGPVISDLPGGEEETDPPVQQVRKYSIESYLEENLLYVMSVSHIFNLPSRFFIRIRTPTLVQSTRQQQLQYLFGFGQRQERISTMDENFRRGHSEMANGNCR